ncbi:hypothetical protein EE612_040253 [Oryza sativa]|nr:hypothetical protein EE612_040253 [Oryza sativa]
MATPAPDVSAIGAALRSPAATVGEADVEKLRLIEELTSDVDAVQERVLSEILGRNAGAEYLTRCGLDAGDTGRATFRAKVPVVSYDDLKPYIQRVADGDCSPVPIDAPHHRVPHQHRHVGRRVQADSRRHGRLRPPPGTARSHWTCLETVSQPLLHGTWPVRRKSDIEHFAMYRYVPGLEKGKGLNFMFVKSETKTRGGPHGVVCP